MWSITRTIRHLRKTRSKLPGTAALAVALSMAIQSCSQGERGVSVTSSAPTTKVAYLDDIEWKQRTEFGRAYSNWAFLTTTHFDLKKVDEKDQDGRRVYEFEIVGANIKVGLECTETLPIGVKDPLRKHEDMHCQMTTECFQSAPDTAKKIAQELVGQKITIAECSDLKSAEKQAQLECKRRFSNEYRVTTQTKADKLAEIFDSITNHGLNGVTNEDGRQRSYDQYDRDYKPLENANAPGDQTSSQSAASNNSPEPNAAKVKGPAKAKVKETVKTVDNPEEAKRLQSTGAWKNAPIPATEQKNGKTQPESSDGPIVTPAN
ncbi:MAG TPA: hypothetical protein V6C97_08970 [Oculatellaceae cyanobacterium]